MFFDASTGTPLAIAGNPMRRYTGLITNYSLQEDWNSVNRSSSNTIVMTCASKVDLLSNTYTGRRTNPESWKKFNPTDVSMDRVPGLMNTSFNFGAPL